LEFRNGRIYDYQGGYAYYRELKSKEQSFLREKTADNQKAGKQQKTLNSEMEHSKDKSGIKDKKANNENCFIMKIESEIEELENKKKECHKKLDSETDYNKLNEILSTLSDIDGRIDILMAEWEKYI
jgi:ATPase subunit of ABC transporter with duplicated ATPase domains